MKTFRALKVILILNSISAFGGGLFGIFSEDLVKTIRPPPIFGSFLVPSIILIVLIGFSNLTAFFVLKNGKPWAPHVVKFAGVSLVLWIFVQVWMIGFLSWLQPFMLIDGLALAFIGFRFGPRTIG